MNEELFQLYVEGLMSGWFSGLSNTSTLIPDEIEDVVLDLESTLGRFHGTDRRKNTEFVEAKRIVQKLKNSPLLKALS